MPYGITRRDFLRYSAAALGSLWAAPLLSGSYRAVQAAAPQQLPAPSAVFEPMPSPALLGTPIDVSIGADGVFWALGASGAPSTFAPHQNTWEPFGGGLDAVCLIPVLLGPGEYGYNLCAFRGEDVVELGQGGTAGPVPIAQRWPDLPPSFQSGVDAAAYGDNFADFYLFRNGQMAKVGIDGTVTISPIDQLGGWPGGAWQGGNFDLVVSGFGSSVVTFVLGDESISAFLGENQVLDAPRPLREAFQGSALDVLNAGGVDAMLYLPNNVGPILFAMRGAVAYGLVNQASTAAPEVSYLADFWSNWPSAWHPVLAQAPAGSIGNLWSRDGSGMPLLNAGAEWDSVPLPFGVAAVAVDAGADGTVYAASDGALYLYEGSGSWRLYVLSPYVLEDVAVGDAAHVWVRDNQGNVYRFDPDAFTFTKADLGVTATDFAANPDGTLWHCNAGQANAYRFISEGSLSSESIAVGSAVSAVQKAASIGFGTGFFLVQGSGQSGLIRYESPYIFKTASQYWTAGIQQVAVGASSIFMFTEPVTASEFFVVALDIQNGAERWRFGYPTSEELYGYSPIYDPQHQLVYVFSAIGYVYALDAYTGVPAWSLPLPHVIPVQPVLAGGLILIAAYDNPLTDPNSQAYYMIVIDSADAAQRARSGGQPEVAWSTPATAPGATPAPTPPVFHNGFVYGVVWSGPPWLTVTQYDAATGEALWTYTYTELSEGTIDPYWVQPIVGRVTDGLGNFFETLLVNVGEGVYAFMLNGIGQIQAYQNPALGQGLQYAGTNLLLYDDVVYFGDTNGNLYALDDGLNLLPGYPVQMLAGQFYTNLVLTTDDDGAAVIVVGDAANNNLRFFSTATGNLLTLPTNQTGVIALSDITREGLLYAGGQGPSESSSSLGQVFAIRTADVSALRDFVIESQLLQDYDPSAVAVARYQTHVTIVDAAKTPLPFTSVKLWADDAITVQVDGQSYGIGPDTPLATQVDASGMLSIVSSATDLFATPLRIWAAFMDPFERILIYPDQEFHARLPAMIADPNNDDPTVINLATGTNYGGSKVFTDQQQAQSIASGVAMVSNAIGLGGNAGLPGARRADAAQPYVAYDDLTGIAYLPANTLSTRTAVTQGRLGLSLDATGGGFAVATVAAAAAAIDALAGIDDNQLLGGFGSWFSGLWDKIKKGVAKVTKTVISIGSAVYMGIQYTLDGVTHVLRHVVRDIEDVAAMVGTFFVQLGKAIEDVIELLSLLLHFDQVVATHLRLKTTLLGLVGELASNMATNGKQAIDTFLATGEQTIQTTFNTVKTAIGAGAVCSGSARISRNGAATPAVGDLCGTGATAHTVFTVAPKTGGKPSSHAVLATWGIHKVRNHYKQATTTATAAPGTDPISGFITSFAASLSENPTLQQAFAATQNDFAATFKAKSASDFLAMAAVDLLDILQDLMLTSLAITQALMAGLVEHAGDLVTFLFDSQSGFLTRPLDIPILSDLYSYFFKSELTFLDLVLLVASIPITFLYRVIEGSWFAAQADEDLLGLTPLQRGVALLNSVVLFAKGVLAPLGDAVSMFSAATGIETIPIFGNIVAALNSLGLLASLFTLGGSNPLIAGLSGAAWMLGVGILLGGLFFVPGVAPAVVSFVALARSAVYVFEVADPGIHASILAFSGNLMGALPTVAQPIKYLASTAPVTATALLMSIDAIGFWAAAAVTIASVALNWDALPPPTALPPGSEPAPGWNNRLILPFIGNQP